MNTESLPRKQTLKLLKCWCWCHIGHFRCWTFGLTDTDLLMPSLLIADSDVDVEC